MRTSEKERTSQKIGDQQTFIDANSGVNKAEDFQLKEGPANVTPSYPKIIA